MSALRELLQLSGAAVLLLATAWNAVAWLRIRSGHRAVLAAFVCACAEVFAILQILSWFEAISAANVALCEGALLLVVGGARWRARDRFPGPPVRPRAWFAAFWAQMPGEPGRTLLTGALVVCVALPLFFALAVPQNNPDSLAYHLVRSATWRQNRTLAHVSTENHRQNEMPVVAEMGVLWFMLFAPGDRYAGLLQWSALWVCGIALYGLLRRAGAARGLAPLAFALFASLPMVVLQASSTQNDLLLAAFLIAGLAFCAFGFEGARPAWNGLVVSAAAFGLAMGTKGYALLFAPGIGLFAFWAARALGGAARVRAWLAYGLLCAAATLVFCLPNWVRNLESYGHPLLTPEEMALHRVEGVSLATAVSILSKNLASFIELGRWADELDWTASLDERVAGALEALHRGLGIEVDSPRTTSRSDYPFATTVGARNQALVYFGALGWLLLLPAGAVVALRGWVRPARSASPLWELAGALATVAWTFYGAICVLSKWHPADGRLLCGFALCLVPAAVCALHGLARLPRAARALATAACVLLGGASTSDALFWNSRAPLLPREGWSILGASRDEMRHQGLREESATKYARTAQLVDARVPADGRLGVALAPRELSYFYFGEDLERKVIPTPLSELRALGVSAFLDRHELDAVLINPFRTDAEGRQTQWPDDAQWRLWQREDRLEAANNATHVLVRPAQRTP